MHRRVVGITTTRQRHCSCCDNDGFEIDLDETRLAKRHRRVVAVVVLVVVLLLASYSVTLVYVSI